MHLQKIRAARTKVIQAETKLAEVVAEIASRPHRV